MKIFANPTTCPRLVEPMSSSPRIRLQRKDRWWGKKRGVSSLAALFTLLSLTAMGAVIAYLVAAGEESRANHLLSTQAFYVTQAGLEYGVKKIYEAQSPVVPSPGVSFANGSFTISHSGRTVTVTGVVGNATRAYSVDSPTEADCTLIDTTNYHLSDGDKDISQITFRKICLIQTTVDKMQFSWVPDNGERLEEIKIESLTAYDNPAGAPSGTLLDVANYVSTTGNNNVMNKIEFNVSVLGKTVTMTFTMGDQSTKTVTFGPLD